MTRLSELQKAEASSISYSRGGLWPGSRFLEPGQDGPSSRHRSIDRHGCNSRRYDPLCYDQILPQCVSQHAHVSSRPCPDVRSLPCHEAYLRSHTSHVWHETCEDHDNEDIATPDDPSC